MTLVNQGALLGSPNGLSEENAVTPDDTRRVRRSRRFAMNEMV